VPDPHYPPRLGPALVDLLVGTYDQLDALRVEAVCAFDASGKELFRSQPDDGSEDEIAIPDSVLPLLQGAIIVHNHPAGWDYPPVHPMHAGKSFSQEDVFFAVEYDLLELQAVTPIWIYWFRRPEEGWIVSAREVQARFVAFVNDVAEEMLGLILAGLLTIEEGEPELFHQAMVALAQECGAGYGRWRRRMEVR
jgi:hypothetical protein